MTSCSRIKTGLITWNIFRTVDMYLVTCLPRSHLTEVQLADVIQFVAQEELEHEQQADDEKTPEGPKSSSVIS